MDRMRSEELRAALCTSPMPGDILISSVTALPDELAQAVILVVENEDEGALGVMLNRRSDLTVSAVLPEWADSLFQERLFHGGPVGTDSALCLAQLLGNVEAGPLGWRKIFGDVGLLHLDADPHSAALRYSRLRVYAGFVGWGAGQLAEEIADGAWYVQKAKSEDVFTDSPETLWRDVLRRIPGENAFLSTWTDFPELN